MNAWLEVGRHVLIRHAVMHSDTRGGGRGRKGGRRHSEGQVELMG